MREEESIKSIPHVYLKLIFIALSFILWVDALTGMIQFYIGIDLKLSLLYKLPLIAMFIIVIGLYSRVVFSLILLSITMLLLSKIASFE